MNGTPGARNIGSFRFAFGTKITRCGQREISELMTITIELLQKIQTLPKNDQMSAQIDVDISLNEFMNMKYCVRHIRTSGCLRQYSCRFNMSFLIISFFNWSTQKTQIILIKFWLMWTLAPNRRIENQNIFNKNETNKIPNVVDMTLYFRMTSIMNPHMKIVWHNYTGDHGNRVNARVLVPDGLLMNHIDVLVSLCSEARPFNAHIDVPLDFENVLMHFGTSAVMCSHLLAMRWTFAQTGLFLIRCPKSWFGWICHIMIVA